MKKLLLVTFLFLSVLDSRASHVAGGELTYEFVGDSINPYRYVLTLTLYRRNAAGSSGFASNYPVRLLSSCFPLQNFNLTRILPAGATPTQDGGYRFEQEIDCVDPKSSDYFNVSVHKYQDTVNLPGKCSNHVFSFYICCRNIQITNLAAIPGFYIESVLNNTIHNNSSPSFEFKPVINTCLNKPGYNHFGCSDKDGDSLFYKMVVPHEDLFTPIGYANGYSHNQPIATTSGTSFDSIIGLMTYTPSQVQLSVVAVEVSEYRFSVNDSDWVLVGSITRDMEVKVNSSCKPASAANVFSTNSTAFDTATTITCGDSIFTLKLAIPVMIDSVTSSGSEFSIWNGGSDTIEVMSAKPGNMVLGSMFTDELIIEVESPLILNDTLTLLIKPGTDRNTLISICGDETPRDSITIAVTSCTSFFDLSENQKTKRISAYPNPVKEMLTISAKHSTTDRLTAQVVDVFGKEVQLEVLNSSSGKGFQLSPICIK